MVTKIKDSVEGLKDWKKFRDEKLESKNKEIRGSMQE